MLLDTKKENQKPFIAEAGVAMPLRFSRLRGDWFQKARNGGLGHLFPATGVFPRRQLCSLGTCCHRRGLA